MKTKLILMFAAVLVISACADNGVSTEKTSNPRITPTLLFEHEGMSVYRFSDAGRYVYYVDGRGRTEWTTTQSNGKTLITKRHSVETAQ